MRIFVLATLWALVGFVIVVFVAGHAPNSKGVMVFVPMLWVGSLLALWAVDSSEKDRRA